MFLICYFVHSSIAQKESEQFSSKIKWGVHVGINASVPHLSDFTMNGVESDDFQEIGKVGFFTSVSWRHVFNRFYLQPEIMYSYMNGSTIFNISEKETGINYIGQQLSFKNQSVALPLFAGYNFIQKAPYIMSFYLGPQFTYSFSSKYFYNGEKIAGNITPFKFKVSLGLGAIIGNLSLDFRYDFDPIRLKTTHETITIEDDKLIVETSYKRRINTMSFAIGYYF